MLKVSMVFGAVLVFGVGTATAQSYPIKPIRIVAAGPGSSGDILSRLVAPAIARPLGQPVIVENQPAGVMPGQTAAHSVPDGYTMLVYGNAFWLAPLLQTTPYDPVRDFQPITEAVRQPSLMVVHPAVPANSVKEFIALAKSRPGQLNYATGSSGSVTHLAGELFQAMAEIKMERISYKAGGQGVADVMAGRVQVMFAGMTLVAPHMKSGKLKVLGVTSPQPTDLVPGVPTVAASGLPGFQTMVNLGMFAPAKTPRAVVDRLNREIARAVSSAEVKDKLIATGVEPVGGTPEQFASLIKAEIETVGRVIKERGIRLE